MVISFVVRSKKKLLELGRAAKLHDINAQILADLDVTHHIAGVTFCETDTFSAANGCHKISQLIFIYH